MFGSGKLGIGIRRIVFDKSRTLYAHVTLRECGRNRPYLAGNVYPFVIPVFAHIIELQAVCLARRARQPILHVTGGNIIRLADYFAFVYETVISFRACDRGVIDGKTVIPLVGGEVQHGIESGLSGGISHVPYIIIGGTGHQAVYGNFQIINWSVNRGFRLGYLAF